ncbi:hypothetical protein BBF96_00120 [Anoxybacter fermentans]|uniref:Uncharacterized protein n=1 Tax=Anoxybacter fermentans TaxID=1323375 RepID=A0A3Q9HNB9_9FIRM|nr:hypothetical protein BBF96_00120 [Anoxybacter fermentans]
MLTGLYYSDIIYIRVKLQKANFSLLEKFFELSKARFSAEIRFSNQRVLLALRTSSSPPVMRPYFVGNLAKMI